MPVPATINDLSTTASSNYPLGSEPVFPLLDDHLRFSYSCIAYLRDNCLSQAAAPGTITVTATGVGIGTTTPAGKFHVKGSGAAVILDTGAATDGRLEMRYSGTAQGSLSVDNGFVSLIANSGKYLQFKTGGSETMRLDASGNLGLGVTPSGWGTGFSSIEHKGGAFGANATGANYLLQNTYYNGTNFIYKTTAPATYFQQNSGAFSWYTAASGSAGAIATFTQAMTLDASGNLCLGTVTAGAYKLNVNGAGVSIGATGTGNNSVQAVSTDAGAIPFIAVGNGTRNFSIRSEGTDGALTVRDNTAAAERLRIASSGDITAPGAFSAGGAISAGGKITAGADASASNDVPRLAQVNSLISAAVPALASNAEVQAGTSSTKTITPAGLFSALDRSLGGNGYQKLPGGLIIQWGSGTGSTGGGVAVSFPISFPTNCAAVTVTHGSNGSSLGSAKTYNIGLGGFSAVISTDDGSLVKSYLADPFRWIAIGY